MGAYSLNSGEDDGDVLFISVGRISTRGGLSRELINEHLLCNKRLKRLQIGSLTLALAARPDIVSEIHSLTL